MSEPPASIASRLNQLLAAADLDPLDARTATRFGDFCALLLRWNARMNLTAIRDEDGVLSRHFVESIACAHALPETAVNVQSNSNSAPCFIALVLPSLSFDITGSEARH